MANKRLFARASAGRTPPATDTINEAGGAAYERSDKSALATYAATGCLNGTFYASAEDQLEQTLKLCKGLDPEFIGKVAVYARERSFMKDMPALLCAYLAASKSPGAAAVLRQVFPRVIDSGKMVRNFVQILRSGALGRKSLGTLPKKLVVAWLNGRRPEYLFNQVGRDPSMADVIKMVHPRPASPEHEAIYGYLTGAEAQEEGSKRKWHLKTEALPPLVLAYEAWKKTKEGLAPNVDFRLLTALELSKADWLKIAVDAPWQATRMNLQTFARHGVFESAEAVGTIAARLRDPKEVRRARVFPYQLLMAYRMADGLPHAIQEALQDAMEIAVENVPEVTGKVVVCPDISGSMQSSVTGRRGTATSKVQCVDVAALVSAAFLRRNRDARVIPFSDGVVPCRLNPRDSVMSVAHTIRSLPSGGTNCSAPLALLNRERAKADLVVYVSDNQSWVETATSTGGLYRGGAGSGVMTEWERFRVANPSARLVLVDIQPYGTAQAVERKDILLVGGWSDAVFDVIAAFARGGAQSWVEVIERMLTCGR